ncbi:DUF1801 domain-containing protein [Massilia sp. B-10]|nr:DUF1801 domain-containing protein [Massilia sp. B-10]
MTPCIDAYIANAAEFAQPILTHLRAVVHAACPDTEETMKWSMPHFQYNGMLCGMASFKAHCAFNFWKGACCSRTPKRSRWATWARSPRSRICRPKMS